MPVAKPSREGCSLFNCFDVYRCGGLGHGGLKVYIHPPVLYLKPSGEEVGSFSTEYFSMLEAVFDSKYYTDDPDSACLFLPSLDLLSLPAEDHIWVGRALASLPHWDGGRNHLIFSMLPPSSPPPTDMALLATTALAKIRPGFDLPIAALPPARSGDLPTSGHPTRPYLVVIAQTNIDSDLRDKLEKEAKPWDLVTVTQDSSYLPLLGSATYCLVDLSSPLPPSLLVDCLSHGSVPVLLSPSVCSHTLPLSPVIDWASISVNLRLGASLAILQHLHSLPPDTLRAMQAKGATVYSSHLSSPAAQILSVLDLLEKRLSPTASVPQPPSNPLSSPMMPPQSQGFTALILTYNRVESLFQVIRTLGEVESLARIVVVWNHQTVPPPPVEDWPKVTKPLKVIQTGANLLSNRFKPYEEIQTEAVLSLDDDITMLTKDELEFGYQVWRQFPDRIVGFPSRTHFWQNATSSYRYESEWTNELSLVLTGVAFYHSYWHYLYTAAPSKEQLQIRDWVDQHMNCEDIAFNLMVSNATGKPPIKVGPRKKFKCSTPSCENVGMLSSAAGHLEERSRCLDLFLKLYGDPCPLKQVQFRADPVLYKENLPPAMKKFNDIGSL